MRNLALTAGRLHDIRRMHGRSAEIKGAVRCGKVYVNN